MQIAAHRSYASLLIIVIKIIKVGEKTVSLSPLEDGGHARRPVWLILVVVVLESKTVRLGAFLDTQGASHPL